MSQRTVDLAAHINEDVGSGTAADFPVTLRPLTYRTNGAYVTVPGRLAVVREDTGVPLAVVSERYTLLPHGRILSAVEDATVQLDVGPVPRGVYVDRKGARMRALFKFPALAQPVLNGDNICPCVKIQNTYDATSRVRVHIGAFRFVCTNLAVGGGGVFAGGFMAVHSGEIPAYSDEVALPFRGKRPRHSRGSGPPIPGQEAQASERSDAGGVTTPWRSGVDRCRVCFDASILLSV